MPAKAKFHDRRQPGTQEDLSAVLSKTEGSRVALTAKIQ